jgi:hypothetical protein
MTNQETEELKKFIKDTIGELKAKQDAMEEEFKKFSKPNYKK